MHCWELWLSFCELLRAVRCVLRFLIAELRSACMLAATFRARVPPELFLFLALHGSYDAGSFGLRSSHDDASSWSSVQHSAARAITYATAFAHEPSACADDAARANDADRAHGTAWTNGAARASWASGW